MRRAQEGGGSTLRAWPQPSQMTPWWTAGGLDAFVASGGAPKLAGAELGVVAPAAQNEVTVTTFFCDRETWSCKGAWQGRASRRAMHGTHRRPARAQR